MTTESKKIRFGALVGSVACAVVLAGCASGQGTEEPGSTQGAPAPGGMSDPKDAAKVDPCALLSPQAAEALGLNAQGRLTEGSFSSDAKNACAWENESGVTSVGFGVIEGRSVEDYYSNSSEFVDFAKLTIAGHPAVRANRGDPKVDGACGLFVQTKPGQMVQSTGQVGSSERGTTDPCALAQKALESALPTWPAVK